MRRMHLLVVAASLVGVTVVAYGAPSAWRLIEGRLVGIHQTSVRNEMALWEREYRTLKDWHEASNAIGMIGYVQRYYVPGPGYRGTARTEAELEEQRARTLSAIVAGLRDFTRQDFGTDETRWRQWLVEHDHTEAR